jgi:hypothetical protein
VVILIIHVCILRGSFDIVTLMHGYLKYKPSNSLDVQWDTQIWYNFMSVQSVSDLIPYVSYRWSTRPLGLRCGSVAACLLTLWVRIPLEAWTPVCVQCCLLLSSRGLCDWPINQLESYWVWCVLSVTLKPQGWGGLGPSGCRAKKKVYPYWEVLCSQMDPEICYKDWDLFCDFSRFLQADEWKAFLTRARSFHFYAFCN